MSLNARQQAVIRLLSIDRNRDLYEVADRANSKLGSGRCLVTYGPHQVEITVREAEQLEAQGLVRRKWGDPTLNYWTLA